MQKTRLNWQDMLQYFKDFDVFRSKFFYGLSIEKQPDADLYGRVMKAFQREKQASWGTEKSVEAFLTMNKVYHYGESREMENSKLLECVADKFWDQYVDIDGMSELFRASYFYFEWMMHLEYVEKKHDYSYYRDHFLHQIRNLYEMFFLLEKKGLWRACMDSYMYNNSIVSDYFADSIRRQKQCFTEEEKEILDMLPNTSQDDWCYHYIIFATSIVASLVHDIGYPMVYMKRNIERLQSFLPMSYLFMDLNDNMSHIKSLLSGSLLFASVDNKEIEMRLGRNDHGAYSAIILLCQYYDNGRIFSLEPVKRMVVELSALVIYNHTLKYSFQQENREGKTDRFQNVFLENPVSYLFRLCDDMQEWERVYFQITGMGSFFVCNKCKTPMIRMRNAEHNMEGVEDQKSFEYTCVCGEKGINTVWFPYRRMINVAPFEGLTIWTKGNSFNGQLDKLQWALKLDCDKKALLQLAKYNPSFAMERLKGIQELRGMVDGQVGFPQIYVDSFISNNPVAIKARILQEFIMKYERRIFGEFDKNISPIVDVPPDRANGLYWREHLNEIRQMLDLSDTTYRIYEKFVMKAENWETASRELFVESIAFYMYLIFVGRLVYWHDLGTGIGVYNTCYKIAEMIAEDNRIRDMEMVELITDCIVGMYCDVSRKEFFDGTHIERYRMRHPVQKDICEIVQKYTEDDSYKQLCVYAGREIELGERVFDYYSDYFLYFQMDCCAEGKA